MSPDPQPQGAVLAGNYRLDEQIGRGGMGSVYRGLHVLLNRPVAVKLVELSGSDPQLAERFLREAQVAAAVRHPNVVDILDFGTTDAGQPFMVMELLEGQSLMDRMIDGPELTTAQIVSVIGQLLAGLDAVHRAGIVHRDLKPANIFLTEDDGTLFARLLDFGISYSVDPNSDLRRGRFGTDERLVMGTPEYMSPEQAEGRRDVDVRSDVWSVGVLLYELLSRGMLPYEDPNPGGVLFKIMSGGHAPLAELRPDLPEIAGVVELALSRERERRPQSARELRRLLFGAAGVPLDGSGLQALERISSVELRVNPARTARSERPTIAPAATTGKQGGSSKWWIPPVVAVGIAVLALVWAAFHRPEGASPAMEVGAMEVGATEVRAGAPSAELEATPEPSSPVEAARSMAPEPSPVPEPVGAETVPTAVTPRGGPAASRVPPRVEPAPMEPLVSDPPESDPDPPESDPPAAVTGRGSVVRELDF